jgi:hypothetical protein
MSNMSECVLHADIVEIKHILLPEGEKRFKDIFVVFELMETDLHQVSCPLGAIPCFAVTFSWLCSLTVCKWVCR